MVESTAQYFLPLCHCLNSISQLLPPSKIHRSCQSIEGWSDSPHTQHSSITPLLSYNYCSGNWRRPQEDGNSEISFRLSRSRLLSQRWCWLGRTTDGTLLGSSRLQHYSLQSSSCTCYLKDIEWRIKIQQWGSKHHFNFPAFRVCIWFSCSGAKNLFELI